MNAKYFKDQLRKGNHHKLMGMEMSKEEFAIFSKEEEEHFSGQNKRIEATKPEGYWWSKCKENSSYPMPIANELTEEEAQEICNLIQEKENTAEVVCYFGFSFCRLQDGTCPEMLGTREYLTEKYRWPEDFAKHYVLKHRVRPSDEFLEFIGYK